MGEEGVGHRNILLGNIMEHGQWLGANPLGIEGRGRTSSGDP